MKKLVEDWLFMAEMDIQTCERLITDEYLLTNIIAFHCQQAIEKYLKAYLIENNVSLLKTHDLIKLNNMVKGIDDFGIDEKKLMHINEVYTETRYPGEIGLLPDGFPTEEEAREFLEYAQKVKTIIRTALQGSDTAKI